MKTKLFEGYSPNHNDCQQLIEDYSLKFALDEQKSDQYLTPYHLSFFYLDNIEKEKSKGQFVTPAYLSEYLIEQSLSYLLGNQPDLKEIDDFITNKKCADITCGTGNLLLSLLYVLKDKLENKTDNYYSRLLNFINNNLYGYDIDENVLLLCQFRLYCFVDQFLYVENSSKFNLSKNFYKGNILIDSTIEHNLSKNEEMFQKLEENILNKKYDLILENPPFMIYGLRNSQTYKKSFKTFLRKRYEVAEYKLPLYPIFMQRSIELLKDKGLLAIITPDSFLLGRYYSKIRKYILRHTTIKEITLLDFEPFKNVSLGRTVLSFMSKSENEDKTFYAKWYETIDSLHSNKAEILTNFQQELYGHLYRFQLYFNAEEKNYVKKWQENASKKLEDVVTIHTGIRSKIGQKNIISKKQINSSWRKGIISGKQILPYKLIYEDDWIHVKPDILWSGGHDKEVIENPKLLIRQTGDSIVSCYDEQGYYHLNNCHSISPKTSKLNLKALAVILNSSEFNKLYYILSMEKGRALAQIDIDFLLKMPYIELTESETTKLEFYYNKQTNLGKEKLRKHQTKLSGFLDHSKIE